MKNFAQMMKQAQQMQARMAEQMEQLEVEATSGGGMVSVTMDGHKKLLSLTIDPESVDPEEVEMLQDLILAAVNEAQRKVEEALEEQMGGLTQGLLGGL